MFKGAVSNSVDHVKSLSCARLFVTPWIVACTKLLRPWHFQGKKYWSGLPFPSPGNCPNPGIKPRSLTLWTDTLPSEPPGKFPHGSDSKASVYNVRDLGLIPGLGRFPGEGNGNPLQYSCLENPMHGGAWCRLLSMGSQRVRHN